MKKFFFLFRYIRYRLKAGNDHSIHSPFVFDLYNHALNKKGSYYAFNKIEQLRKKLLLSKKEIEVSDFGTGKSGKRSIAEIASNAAKSRKYGELLFRVANYFKPDIIIELGTSLGISTSYLASGFSSAKIITMEGCPNTAEQAKRNFDSISLKNIEQVTGDFKATLPCVLSNLKIKESTTIFFFDGNHKKKPTLFYFYECLKTHNANSIFIFDDIHWSEEMEEAWEEIKKHPSVTVTIDLFFLGLVFFRKEQVKQDFVLRV